MLPSRDQLTRATDIQGRAYRLLRWVDDSIKAGHLQFPTVHDDLDEVDAAMAWLREIWPRLPEDARPLELESSRLREFANYFTSYLMVSFDLSELPRDITRPDDLGCRCPMCVVLARRTHLVPRAVGSGVKRAANELCIEVLQWAADKEGVELGNPASRLRDHELRRCSAIVAYAGELVARVEGRSAHPRSLALWRRFAFTEGGSPRPGFSWSVQLVDEAVATLNSRLRGPQT